MIEQLVNTTVGILVFSAIGYVASLAGLVVVHAIQELRMRRLELRQDVVDSKSNRI